MARPRPKRTVGELTAAWFLLLWGIGVCLLAKVVHGNILITIGLLLHGLLSLLGGMATLAGNRSLARALALGAAMIAFLAGSATVYIFFFATRSPNPDKGVILINLLVLLAASLIFLPTLGLMALAFWIGKQEDSEE